MLKGKNILITGTNRGIGKVMLEKFAQNGASIWAHSRCETPEFINYIRDLEHGYNVKITPIYFDMTDYESMKLAVQQIRKEKRPIDTLINNAGIMQGALFCMTTQDILRNQFEVNFFSVYTFTQYILKLMIKQGYGNIVNIASTVAIDGNIGKSAYAASKAAIIAMTKTISNEVGTYGIRANCIAPGVVETDLLSTMTEEIVQKARVSSALKRSADPLEIANVAVLLSSDNASFINGQTIRVDGGM